jgi:uncharacterized protein (TIGR03435 family)
MRTRVVLSVALLALALPVLIASAQSPGVAAEATERFEVATVKQNKSSSRSGPGFSGQPGRFSAQDATLQDLIVFAYELQPFEIFGGPSWATSDRFDIAATMQAPPTGSAQGPRNRRLLRALLAERFKLVAHEERREMPVYALVRARADRTLGARLSPFKAECGDLGKLGPPPESEAVRLPESDPGKGPQHCLAVVGVGRMSARGMTLSDLSRSLATFAAIRRRVIDRTSLTGLFDYDLEWTPIAAPAGVPASAVPSGSDGPPNIFTALQEQLGLKLESTKEVIPVLVIDSVNQPSEN